MKEGSKGHKQRRVS